VNQDQARKVELACLKSLKRFDQQGGSIRRLLKLLRDYDEIHDGRKDRSEDYGKTLEDRPWKQCACPVCRELGIRVVIFRGAERNRRRGFHNLYVTYHHFHQQPAWGLPPRQSRLMHGAGIISLGFLMDAIADRHRQLRIPAPDDFAADLLPLRNECRWTDGYWDFGPGAQRKRNEIQNTTRDIQALSNHLLVRYKALVWNRPLQPATNGNARKMKTRTGRKTG